jgi:putative ABC transport system permease protein
MFRLTVRGLWAHKLRFLLTGVAVVLGVAFMSGTMILTDTMSRTFNGLLADSNEGIDAVVRTSSAVDGEFADTRERVDQATLDRVRAVDGVDAAAGSVEGFAQIIDGNGEVRVTDGIGATVGTAWIDDERLNPFAIAEGRAPAAAGEVVIDKATATREGFELGDTVTVLAKSEPALLTMVGVATFADADGIPGFTLVATDTPNAQALFGEPGRYDEIVVAADGSMSDDELVSRLQQALGADGSIEVLTGEADTADQQAELREDLGFFNTFLMVFAYIALFVGMFIIYNTFSILVAQRTRDLAMLRAIGAGRAQVLRSVLVEALAVGLTASATGLAAGVGLSFALRSLLGAVGVDIPAGSTVVSSGTVVTSVVVGLVVTVVSAMAPAMRASRVKPIAALRDVAIDRSSSSTARLVAGLGVTGAGVALGAAGIAGGGAALSLFGLGALVTILGVFVVGPVIARPVLRLLGVPARIVAGPVGHLARENARRNPKRTAATASALMIGVALVGFITILASSTSAAVGQRVDDSFRADYVVDSGQWGTGGLSPELALELSALPEVDAVSPLRMAPVAIDGTSAELAGVDAAEFGELYDLEPSSGTLADVGPGTVAVFSNTATDKGLAVGDTVAVTFARTGVVDLTVSAIFDERIAGAGETAWIVDLDTFEANVTDQYDRQVYVATADGVDAAEARAAIDAVLVDWPNGTLQDRAEYAQALSNDIDRMLNLIYGLLALAVLIALVGIANTLALSVHERTRELGLLRAVGMARRQVRSLVRWESVMIAVFGTGLGLVLALAGAWAMIEALADQGVTSMVVPGARLAVIVGIAGVAGVVAALGPARRAARLDVLRAISGE